MTTITATNLCADADGDILVDVTIELDIPGPTVGAPDGPMQIAWPQIRGIAIIRERADGDTVEVDDRILRDLAAALGDGTERQAVIDQVGLASLQAIREQDARDEAATHERDAENYRANDADRMARGLDPIHPYAWDEVEMRPGWEDRAVKRAREAGLFGPRTTD